MSFSSERGTSQGPPQGTSRRTPQGIPRRTPQGPPQGASRRTPQRTSQGPPQGTLRGFLWGTSREKTSKEEPKDTSFFGKGKKDKIPRDKFRSILRKSPSQIPGTSRKYYEKDRIGLEKKIAKGKFYISKQNIKKHIQNLKDERFSLTNKRFEKGTEERKKEIKHEIDYLKERSGIK